MTWIEEPGPIALTQWVWTLPFVDELPLNNRHRIQGQRSIYVKDYADAKFGCVPVAQPKTCHYRPRELPGRGTKGPGIPRHLPGKGTEAQTWLRAFSTFLRFLLPTLHSLPPKPYIHPPLPYGGKFWVAQPGHPGFFGLRNVWRRCKGHLKVKCWDHKVILQGHCVTLQTYYCSWHWPSLDIWLWDYPYLDL